MSEEIAQLAMKLADWFDRATGPDGCDYLNGDSADNPRRYRDTQTDGWTDGEVIVKDLRAALAAAPASPSPDMREALEALRECRFRLWGEGPCNSPLAQRVDALLNRTKG